MFKRLDHWLTARGFLSKTALTLSGIGILLTFISFVKGIQVLMFIPAFVLGLFLYSFFDVRYAKKLLVVSWLNEQKLALRILFTKPHSFCTFFLIFENQDGTTFLQPQKNLTFVVPRSRGKFFLLVQGRLDIFRAVIELPSPPEAATDAKPGESENGEIYFSVQEYEDGDELKRIDSLQTAKRQKWYVRKIIHEAPMRRPGVQLLPKILSLISNQNLVAKTDVKEGMIIEWSMIAITILAAHLEWRNFVFTLISLSSTFFVLGWIYLLKWKLPGRGWMNTIALLLFVGCFIEGGVIRDTVPAGTHFLILLAIWKHLFIRERRDAFTYVFLVLFVFVALSLYTLSAWFIILFFLFLVHSVSLFSIYSAGERAEEYQRAFVSPAPRYARLKISGIILACTLVLFFILPHGNQKKDTSLIETGPTNQTGFDEEVALSDVLSIKKDFSKKIVIEKAPSNRISEFGELYWRGMRFDRFAENKWKKPELKTEVFRSKNPSAASETWDVRYYNSGSDALFVPFAPLQIKAGRLVFMTVGADTSLYKFTEPQYNDFLLSLVFAKDGSDNLIAGSKPAFPYRPIAIDKKTNELMQPFWQSLPANVRTNPQALTQYIMNDAGFSYSLRDTAPSLKSFLYEKKQGHCEYFATVLALTLQHLGYEATYVNGYQGGEWNERAQAWVIRGVNAHSWVEVYDKQNGWLRLDATPASSETFFPSRSQGWQLQWYQAYDWVELRWFKYFVSYTGEKQKLFFLQVFVYRRIIFWSIVVFILYRKTHKPLWQFVKTSWQRTPVERFLWWLKRKTKGDTFVLGNLQDKFPELVTKTRKTIFGKKPTSEELRELKKLWKNHYTKSKNRICGKMKRKW